MSTSVGPALHVMLHAALHIYAVAYPDCHLLTRALAARRGLGGPLARTALQQAADEAMTSKQQQRARQCWAAADVAEAVWFFTRRRPNQKQSREALASALAIHEQNITRRKSNARVHNGSRRGR